MFRNEPLTDFTLPEERQKLALTLRIFDQKIRKEPLDAAPIIAGQQSYGQLRYQRLDPSDGSLIGSTRFATKEEALQALSSLQRYAPAWRRTSVHDRAQMLRQAAAIMRDRRSDLSALIIREAGKPWKEADADVAEAIDFCDYYADEAERIWPRRRTYDVLGEDNHYFYQPRGVVVVISPWNFPLAIACGMITASLVTGNCVAFKPSEQTSLIGYALAEILLTAGIPADAFSFLPGFGEEIGRALVASPLTAMICFTGSKPVGLEIIKSAAQVPAGQTHIKKVVAELGGKNAIIVDEDADLDEAVKGVLYSAFGFAGQKCSACSRVIIVGQAYDPFIKRLAAAAASVIIGPASDPATLVGPLIDEESRDRVLNTIRNAESSLNVVFKGQIPATGNFVPVSIFSPTPFTHPLWNEEIFAPVLACAQAAHFEEALQRANESQYALTGGLFSRSPTHISNAIEEFRVGNLYINRAITGAYVCRQPFGGFKLSGIGSKAGGPDYLLQFVEPRVVTENTMRRGFTPETK